MFNDDPFLYVNFDFGHDVLWQPAHSQNNINPPEQPDSMIFMNVDEMDFMDGAVMYFMEE
jgi:hypothetical protein